MPATIAERLAACYVSLDRAAIPDKHVTDVKTLTQDYLGVGLGGSATGSGQIAARFVTEMGGRCPLRR